MFSVRVYSEGFETLAGGSSQRKNVPHKSASLKGVPLKGAHSQGVPLRSAGNLCTASLAEPNLLLLLFQVVGNSSFHLQDGNTLLHTFTIPPKARKDTLRPEQDVEGASV